MDSILVGFVLGLLAAFFFGAALGEGNWIRPSVIEAGWGQNDGRVFRVVPTQSAPAAPEGFDHEN